MWLPGSPGIEGEMRPTTLACQLTHDIDRPPSGIIASVDCNGLYIQNNTVFRGQSVGIFLHRSCNDAIVRGE